MVGDDDQSIYGWRGAETANLLDLERHFPGVKVIRLEQNYRSTDTILSAANAVIKNNSRRRGKQLWSQNGQGARIALHTFADDDAEARRMAEEIEYARLAGGVPWREQAVLFRTNQQSRPWKPPCAKPASAIRWSAAKVILTGARSRTSWPT